MKIKLLVLMLIFSAVQVKAMLPVRFYKALNMVETNGKQGRILGDNGNSLGPLQISYAYWLDSGIKSGKYADCADYNYACKVVESYLQAYAPKAVKTLDFQTLARIHNGGPNGHNKQVTLNYWLRVKNYLKNV